MSSLIEKDEIINLQHNEKFQSEVLFDYENILIHLDSLSNNIQKKLSDILNKNNIGKKDREDIKDMFNQLSNYTNQKFEFMQSQFQKKMEKHIAEAKSEIDSTLTNIALNKNNNKKKLEE